MKAFLARRSAVIALSAAALLGGLGALPAQAQSFPAKPIKLVVPYAPGGGVDIVARTLADYISTKLGKLVIVENRTGAGGNVGSAFVAKSDPDGYTLLLGSNANAINNNLYANAGYNAATDLTQIVLVGTVPMVLLASPTVAAKNVKELLAQAKAKPGSLNVGSGGSGTAEHLAFELFKRQTGMEGVHVPYKGGAAVYTDLIGGQIQLFFNNQLGATPYVRSGQLRALGITSPTRSSALPDVATFAEQGFAEFKAFVWWGVIGPAGIPKDTVTQINALFNKAISSPEVSTRLESLGAQPQGGTPEKFAEFFKAEMTTWAGVIKAADIKLN
jgi:tripartite-type tricarboxylate transporter receptor subunit TctC